MPPTTTSTQPGATPAAAADTDQPHGAPAEPAADGGARLRLTGSLDRVRDLSVADRDRAYALLETYYSGTDRARFDADLDEKKYIVMLRDSRTRELQGFCTIHVDTVDMPRGGRATVMFTGDTVVDRAYWGQKQLHTQISRLLLRLKLRHPVRPLYWFLISKGYKTYKIMVRSCAHMVPRHDRPSPAPELALLDQLATARFGDRWDAGAGVIRSRGQTEHVREGISEIPADLATSDPHVAYFLGRNPGYVDGDELACLSRMRYADMLGTIVRARKTRKAKAAAKS